MTINSDVSDLGRILGGAIAEATSYKQDFVETEEVGDIILAALETVHLESSLFVCRQDIGTAFILGHPTNGVLASSIYLLGSSGLGVKTCIFVNSDSEYQYNYFDEDFSSTARASIGTAYWDTTTPKLAMSSLSSHLPKITYYDIGPFDKWDYSAITAVQYTSNETKWNPSDSIAYYVSVDNKMTWNQLSSSGYTTLPVSGTSGYLRIIFTGNGNKDTYVQDLSLRFI